MKNWKLFEELTGMIFDALKQYPDVKVRTNVRVPDLRGKDRQIDVLIEHSVSSIPVCVAIECKHHKDAIAVSQIEAFNSKCARIPSIHRKIFVSKKGFQSGAVEAAKDFKIELYTLEEIVDNLPVLSLLKNYKFSIDKRLCAPHAVKVHLNNAPAMIYKGPTEEFSEI